MTYELNDGDEVRVTSTGIPINSDLNADMKRELRALAEKYGASSGHLLMYFSYDDDGDTLGEFRSCHVGSYGEVMYSLRQRVDMDNKND